MLRIRLFTLGLHEPNGLKSVRGYEQPQFLGGILIKSPADRNND